MKRDKVQQALRTFRFKDEDLIPEVRAVLQRFEALAVEMKEMAPLSQSTERGLTNLWAARNAFVSAAVEMVNQRDGVATSDIDIPVKRRTNEPDTTGAREEG